MNKDAIVLVGTSFRKEGHGVPDMNATFYHYISNAANVTRIDILEMGEKKFRTKNKIIPRNLELLSLSKYLKGKNVHVMHTTDLCTTFPVLDISKGVRAKIMTMHDFYPFVRNPNFGLAQRINDKLKRKCYEYVRYYDHIFARTEEIAKRLVNEFSVDKRNISIQGPIIDHSYEPIYRNKENGKIIIGYINNFTWNKTPMLEYFINVFKSIRLDELELHIYGKGFPFHDLIRNDPRIKYFGYLDDDKLPQTLGSFSAYLSTSMYEGFGIPIAKAKAMKVPVLCYDGDLPNVTKSNTLPWTTESLHEILKNRLWEKVNTNKAYVDIRPFRPDNIVESTLNTYKKVFL
ncbi:MAG: glycosyltransferase [Thermoplasmataceae archaeon]